MSRGTIKTAGFLVIISLVLHVIGYIWLFSSGIGSFMMLGKNDPTATQNMMGMMGSAGLGVAVASIISLIIYFFALAALRSYMNRYANFTRANTPIGGIIWCTVILVVVYIGGMLLGVAQPGMSAQLGVGALVVGLVSLIMAILLFVFYFMLGFRVSAFGKEAGDGAARGLGVLILVICFGVLVTIVIALLGIAVPALFIVAGIAYVILALIMLATWVMFGVVLISGAGKMAAKGM